MLTRLLRLTLILLLISSLLTTISTVIGRASDPIVLAALITPNEKGPQSKPPDEVVLLDLSRFLRADQRIPINQLEYAFFNYTRLGRLLATTYDRQLVGKKYQYQADTYEYDYVSQRLSQVSSYQSAFAGLSSNGEYYHSIPTASRDGRQLAFIDPIDLRLNLYDTVNEETTVLSDLSFAEGPPPALSWSPDSRYIALQTTTSLNLVSVQDGTVRPIDMEVLGPAYFYPTWSDNSRYIWIQRPVPIGSVSVSKNPSIQILDAETGEELALTRELSGRLSLWWGCDSRWLGYIVTTDDGADGYLLDLELGNTLRLNDTPLLADVKIDSISMLPNCTQLVVMGQQSDTPPVGPQRPMAPLYVFDIASKSAELIDERAAIVSATDQQILYEKAVGSSNQLQLFRRDLDPLTAPVLVSEYLGEARSWSNWSPDFTFATYIQPASINSSGGALRYLNAKNGQISPLIPESEFVQGYMQDHWRAFRGEE
jgi:Tol biopolymer transport system component